MVSEKFLHSRSKYLIIPVLAFLFTLAGYFFAMDDILPAAVLFVLGASTSWMIIWLYNVTNQSIALLFDALRNDDTTLQFREGLKNRSLARLYESMNRLNRHFQGIRMRNETNEKYYLSLIKYSATGTLVLNDEDQVELINQVACQYAGISAESTNSNLLRIKNPLFFEAVCALKPGEEVTYKHLSGSRYQLLSFRATLLKKDNRNVKLVSIQDIRHELESRELESYRKLIRVLTHEIMNLMAPVTSVSKKLFAMYQKDHQPVKLVDVDENMLNTTVNGLKLIDEQSDSILNFLENYRRITRLPEPEIHAFDAGEWVEQIRIVFSDKMKAGQVVFGINHDRQLKSIWADKKLLNQVVINLINNAMDAVAEVEGQRNINMELTATAQQHVQIKIANNGPAIPPELQEKIFVPFFTTKANGSGIGLSISREIIKLHNGSLTLGLTLDGFTTFVIEI